MVITSQIKKRLYIFVFTDSAVMEQTYTKGSFRSCKLHNLIVELQELKMEEKLIIHFIWISGTRMIFQETDTLSQGEVLTSSMTVEKFLRSFPLI